MVQQNPSSKSITPAINNSTFLSQPSTRDHRIVCGRNDIIAPYPRTLHCVHINMTRHPEHNVQLLNHERCDWKRIFSWKIPRCFYVSAFDLPIVEPVRYVLFYMYAARFKKSIIVGTFCSKWTTYFNIVFPKNWCAISLSAREINHHCERRGPHILLVLRTWTNHMVSNLFIYFLEAQFRFTRTSDM